MKIVHLNFSLEFGGTETMLVDIVNEQCQHAEIYLIILNDVYNISLVEKIDSRVHLIRIGRPAGSRNPYYLLKLNYVIRRLKPSCIHCHNELLGRLLFRLPNNYLTVHDTRVPTANFGGFSKLFAISRSVQQDIKQRTGLDSALVYNGIPVRSIRSKEGNDPTIPFRVVQISRLIHEKKGQHVLLQAVSQLIHSPEAPNIQVDLIGTGQSLAELTGLVADLKLEKHVAFLGPRDRSYVHEHLREYHLLVQPSFFEGFGLTVAEAMAAGVPVLVSDIEGPLELTNRDEFGSVFSVGDVSDCAKRIREIIENYATSAFQEKITNARSRVRERFDVRRTAHEYLTAYEIN
ncbi:glycosyltransferase [Larkinella terrae]|uniref:Glycosyltransferase n=1 Tax=Larkinella terrae TaxID=2025311 RepID=A0A7K0EUP2_9BACT|nr:glycosyltransferase [Larkinella terrae]MRS65533.1 glycosyltransferase [Larkinella terrae]